MVSCPSCGEPMLALKVRRPWFSRRVWRRTSWGCTNSACRLGTLILNFV